MVELVSPAEVEVSLDDVGLSAQSVETRKGVGREGSCESGADVDALIRCRICVPRWRMVSKEIGLVFCGFRIRVESPAHLVWARLLLTATLPGHEPMSVFPELVTDESTFDGFLSIDGLGKIDRQRTLNRLRGKYLSRYEPAIFGAVMRPQSVFWDVTPVGDMLPNGCDRLMFSLPTANLVKLHLRARLMLTVKASAMTAESYLEIGEVSF